jgi:peptide/nickel transport system substrate-binding protein
MTKLSNRIGLQRHISIFVTLLVLMLLAGGFFSNRVDAAGKDTLVLARAMDINSLDPHIAFCDTCKVVIGMMYETIIKLGPDNKTILPQIAKSWDISKDGMSYTFYLDERAVFADGSPVESKDVKFSIERWQNLKQDSNMYVKSISKVDASDPRKVVITVSSWPSELLGQLAVPYAGIVNSDLAMANGAVSSAGAPEKDKAEAWFMKNSAGSSPFVLESYRPDEEIRLKQNPRYWGKKPAIKRVIIKHVPQSVSQAQMLESGQVDVAMQIDADTAKTIRSRDVVIKSQPSYYFNYVALVPGATNLKVPLTPKVREAIALAIDHEGMLDVTLGGAGRVQPSVIPVEFPGGSGFPTPRQDLAKARKLLAEAGHPNGFEILAVYPDLTSYGVNYSVVMQKVQQDLAKIGIKVILEPVTMAVLRARTGGTVPMTILMWAADYMGSAQYVQYFAMVPGTTWFYLASGTTNDMPSLVNHREAELMEKLQKAGPKEAEKLYHEFAKEMIKDYVIIPIGNPDLLLTYRKNVQGMRYDIITEIPFDEISKR